VPPHGTALPLLWSSIKEFFGTRFLWAPVVKERKLIDKSVYSANHQCGDKYLSFGQVLHYGHVLAGDELTKWGIHAD
jgi:hypothetical protein